MDMLTDKREILECASYSKKILAGIRSQEDVLIELVERLCNFTEVIWSENVSLQKENKSLKEQLELNNAQLRSAEASVDKLSSVTASSARI